VDVFEELLPAIGETALFLWFLCFIALAGYCAYKVITRSDKGLGWKVGWLALLVLAPPLFVVAFVIFGIVRR
jgi:hypothetical protein